MLIDLSSLGSFSSAASAASAASSTALSVKAVTFHDEVLVYTYTYHLNGPCHHAVSGGPSDCDCDCDESGCESDSSNEATGDFAGVRPSFSSSAATSPRAKAKQANDSLKRLVKKLTKTARSALPFTS